MGQLSVKGASGLEPPHLLDITMFWSPRSGGVARYLRSKRDWLKANSQWRHTIMAPGPATVGNKSHCCDAAAVFRGLPVPATACSDRALDCSSTARSDRSRRPVSMCMGCIGRRTTTRRTGDGVLSLKRGCPVTAFSTSRIARAGAALPAPFVSPVRHGLRSEPLGRRSAARSRSRQRRAATARCRLRPVSSAAARRRVAPRARLCSRPTSC